MESHVARVRPKAARLERRSNQQEALLSLGRAALSAGSIEQLEHVAIDLLIAHVEVPIVELHRFQRADRRFHLSSSHGWDSTAAARGDISFDSPLGEALLAGEAVVTDDVRTDPRFGGRPQLEARGVRAGLCVLIGTTDAPLGALSAYSIRTRAFRSDDGLFVEAIGATLGESFRFHEANRRVIEVLDSITDGFCALDGDLCMTYVNQQMADLFGTTRANMLGKSVKEFVNSPENLRYFAEALERNTVVTYETYNPARDRWFEARVYPAPQGASVYSRDITERKMVELHMQRMNAELEERVAARTAELEIANRDLESFSYSVSHDLRAPLRAIDGFGRALDEEFAEVLGTSGRGYLGRMRSATVRMSGLIDALLDMSNLARKTITIRPVDLSAIATSIASDLRESDPDRSVSFEIAPGLHAGGEPMLLRVVLENLLNNAWKFTRHTAHARISVSRSEKTQEFFVRDNGAGFDMAYTSKLFGAFQRLHAQSDYEGTGIGLATVARILHRHGGEIRAEGETGEGASFYFKLPAG